MRNLLIFNFRKLRRQKSFYICVGIMLVMILITASMYKALEAMLDLGKGSGPLNHAVTIDEVVTV